MKTIVPERVSERVRRDSELNAEPVSSSPSLTRLSSAQAQAQMPEPDSDSDSSHSHSGTVPASHHKHSPPTSQSVLKSAHQQSSSTKSSVTLTPHHHRNNSSTLIPLPTNLPSPPPSEIPNPNSRRPSSSPSPSPPLQSPSTSHPPFTPSSSFSPLSAASGPDTRSPLTKRPPASRSSHGIETSTGPPPALITQRSYTAESARKHPTPSDVAAGRPHLKYRSETEKSIDSVIHLAPLPTDEKNSSDPSKAASRVRREAERTRDNMAAATAASAKSQAPLEDDQDSTLRNLNRMSSNAAAHAAEPNVAANRHGEEQSKTTQEDLFLILARSNSLTDHATDAAAKSERRRSRTSHLTSRQPQTPLPPTNGRPSSSGRRFPGHTVSSSQDAAALPWTHSGHPTDSESPPFAKRSSPRERRYAASAHPLDAGRRGSQPVLGPNVSLTTSRMRSGSTRETSPELPEAHGRRQSIRDLSPGPSPRAYRQSNLSYATNGHHDLSPFPEPAIDQGKRPQMHDGDGTESTVSTTAPSTIWDDVEDLKHRMRKLELTGKLPVSSDAAMSNVFGERPPTATTTMTTISSSPKHGRVDDLSPSATTVRGPETAELHPLLHSALAKSRPLIDSNIYMALEATASDALTLAAMTAPGASSAAVPSTTIDRRLRRKADSMCRSLTELCIALTAEKSERNSSGSQSNRRKASQSISIHHDTESGLEPRYLRAASEDPELRSSSRVLDRLEARRTSLLHSNPSHSPRSSPREANTPTQTATTPLTTGRLDRPSTILRRATFATDHSDDRPTSRAVTEVAHFRPSPSSAERPRREYTSQHPLPTSQHSPSVPSSLPIRRSFFSAPSMQSPSTPNVQPGSKRYLEHGPTPPKSVDTARAAEVRRERMASFGGFANGNGAQRGTRVARQMASETSS